MAAINSGKELQHNAQSICFSNAESNINALSFEQGFRNLKTRTHLLAKKLSMWLAFDLFKRHCATQSRAGYTHWESIYKLDTIAWKCALRERAMRPERGRVVSFHRRPNFSTIVPSNDQHELLPRTKHVPFYNANRTPFVWLTSVVKKLVLRCMAKTENVPSLGKY